MISRRDFAKVAAASLAATCVGRVVVAAGNEEGQDPADDLPTPSKGQLAWQNAEVGILYCFDLPVAASVFAPNNAVRERLDPNRYNPSKLDTDQWLEAAKAAGAGYAVFTATHFSGFMQWQSELYPYGVKQSQWRGGKGDVVADFVESCRKVGIAPGIYFSTHRNAYWEVWGHYVNWGKGRGTARQEQFNRVAEKMTEELCSRYGPLVQIWYDAGVKTPAEGGPDVLPIFERCQPDSVFYHSKQRSDHRWIGNEQGQAGVPCWATMPRIGGEVSHNAATWQKHLNHGLEDGPYWSPGMVDVPLRGANRVHNWFWAPGQDYAACPAETLMAMFDRSVGRNCTLVLGEVVDPDGLVPESDVKRLREFGRAVERRFATPAGETSGAGSEIELALPQPRKVDQVVLQEEIAHGERVRAYEVLGQVGGDRWEKLAEGQSIGHKWICRFAPVEVARLKLAVTRAAATPIIRRFAAF